MASSHAGAGGLGMRPLGWFKHQEEQGDWLAKARELEGQVADLKKRLAFMEEQNKRLVREAGPDHKDNAVLRYALSQCRQDRKVLEMHQTGTRAELRMTLGLLNAYQGEELTLPPIHAVATLVWETCVLGMFQEEGKQLAKYLPSGQPRIDAEAWWRSRLSGLLTVLERTKQRRIDEAETAARGLSVDSQLEDLLGQVRMLLAEAIGAGEEALDSTGQA